MYLVYLLLVLTSLLFLPCKTVKVPLGLDYFIATVIEGELNYQTDLSKRGEDEERRYIGRLARLK